MQQKRVAILISGRGSNMAALISAAADPAYPAEIALVVSNRPDAAGLAHAQAEGIPTGMIDHKAFGRDREAFERALDAELTAHAIDLVCLAGFMRLFTPWFVSRWEGRMINIHPALLPAFKGLGTHERALAAGVKLHGATVHFVVPEMDSGPIIIQAAVPVHDDDTPATLAARVLTAEHCIYPLALRWLAERRLAVPVLLPAVKGLDTHEQALTAGAKLHGATVHFVVSEMNADPIIVQVPLHDDDTPATFAARVPTAEHCMYPQALRWLAKSRLAVVDGRCKAAGANGDAGMLVSPSR